MIDNTEIFAEKLELLHHNLMPGFLEIFNHKIDCARLVTLLNTKLLHIVNSRTGPLSIVSRENDTKNPYAISAFSSFHTDGLYCPEVPDFALLYCENPGRENLCTSLSDGRLVIRRMQEANLFDSFRQIQMAYEFEKGQPVTRPIIFRHPFTEEPTIQISTGGHPKVIPPANGSAPSLSSDDAANLVGLLNQWLENAVILRHKWHTNDALVFDNHTYPHRRDGNSLDPERKLVRIWYSVNNGNQHICRVQ